MKKNLALPLMALGIAGLLSGCLFKKKQPAPLPEQRDWEEGFLPTSGTAPPAPLQAQPADQVLFDRIRNLYDTDTLGSPSAPAEIGGLARASSQGMLGAVATPLFSAGVYHGSPQLLAAACEMEERVTFAPLRRSNRLDDLNESCSLLDGNFKPMSHEICNTSVRSMLEGYAMLAAGDEAGARAAIASGVQQYKKCPTAKSLTRTPVHPSETGFLIVVLLQSANMPAKTWLANASIPEIVADINEAFIANQRLLKGA